MLESNLSSATGLVFQKETQIQALWAVYTAVQFAAGGFGLSEWHEAGKMPPEIGFAVFLGVWAFNLGHLSMILKCLAQLDVIKHEIDVALTISDTEKPSIMRIISAESSFSIGRLMKNPDLFGNGHGAAVLIHLFIDICASVALLHRVKMGWLCCLVCGCTL